MSVLEEFAEKQLGIKLTKFQIDFIKAYSDDKQMVYPRAAGITTARKVIKEYLKEGLK